eukprot:6419203-Prymnesium_polylepis.1
MTHECIGRDSQKWEYPTVEHAVTHIKASFMGDQHTTDLVLAVAPTNPLQAKRLRRNVEPWDEDKWQRYVPSVGLAILLAMSSQNDHVARKLRDAGTKSLAERLLEYASKVRADNGLNEAALWES